MSEAPEVAPAASAGRLWLIYTALRLVVFIGTAGVGLVLGLHGFPLVLLALLVSSIVSLFVLRPQRDALVRAQVARREAKAAERQRLRAALDEPPSPPSE